METAAPLGHNAPPSPIEELRDRLAVETAALATRRDELMASADRAPTEVTDEDTSGKIGDLVKLITTAYKNAEKARIGTKEPYLEASRAVDGFFGKITLPLEAAKARLVKRLDAYQTQKVMAARRAAEEQARTARAQADALAAEALAREAAAKASAPAAPVLDMAVAAEKVAIAAETLAAAKPAELSRIRGDLGSLQSQTMVWVGTLTNRATLDLEALRQHIPVDALEQAIRSYVKAGGRVLTGAKIEEVAKTVVR